MVTPADLVTLQQQLRQEVADVIQQLRAEVNEAISGRMDMMNSISAALQRMTAKPAESKPYRISDLIPRNWEGGNEKGEFRSFMSDLHLWMQAWSDQGEQMLAMVESIDRFDNNVIAFDCSDEEFRSIESALYQVLHRTTSNEPLRIVQQTKGQKGFEAWHAIVRRYDQRNMSDKSSAYAALISNISEKDRAKDVEQFDDILRTFTNEMNKFESRFGKIRDEEKMLAVKKLMPESLLNYRFRGTTMSYSELIVALENIIIDKVAMVPIAKGKRHDTSAPMEIGMATKEDSENASQEGDQRIIDLALQAVYKGAGKGKWSFGKGQHWNEKGGKGGKDGGKSSWQKGSGKKGGKGQEKGGKGENRTCWTCGKTGHIAAWCGKGGKKNLYAMDEDDSEDTKEYSNRSTESEEDLQAWCILEESESEQWQEVISRRSRQRAKRTNQASLLSVESSYDLSPKKIVEEKDKWVKVRATMDSGAAGHVMPEAMFPHVKIERKTPSKKFVAANGEQIKDLGAKRIPFKTNEGVQRCITFRSANVVKPLISMQKVVQAGNTVVLDEKNPHIRNTRDGTVIKLDVNNGVYTMDMWICLDETGPVFSWQGQ